MSDSPLPAGSDEELDALLYRLRQRPTAAPSPFFYARVQARLWARASAPAFWQLPWLRRPVYAALLSALVLAVSGDAAAGTSAPSSAAHQPQLHGRP